MRRFLVGAAIYVVAGLAVMIGIVLHGDGPHPRVVAVYPPNGDVFWPGGSVQITFSQFMDQSTVERALQVSPSPHAEGQGLWTGTTLNLQPMGDWRPDITYHISLLGTVTDEEGRPLHTPVSFWFRVHHVQHLAFCRVRGIRNVCEHWAHQSRVLTHSPTPVLQFALSPDGTLLAYTHRDRSGLSHLFLIGVDGSGSQQLTSGRQYADTSPFWTPGDSADVTYRRQKVTWHGSQPRFGPARLWNIETDGTSNAPQ